MSTVTRVLATDGILVSPEDPIRRAMEVIDRGGARIALVVGAPGNLVGAVTDGDVRRGVLRGCTLDTAVSEVMNVHPTVAPNSASPGFMATLMRQRGLRQLPLLDEAGRLTAVALLHESDALSPDTRAAVIMAGGLGLRLRPLTITSPKPMIKVGDRPVLETIIRQLTDHGFQKAFISINHLGEHIRAHFGDGDRFGISIEYLEEPARLGTAGALRLLPERPTGPFLVMNADILTCVNFGAILDYHRSEGAALTVCVRQFDIKVPYGVVEVADRQVVGVEEKPTKTFFVNAGMYALGPQVLDLIPSDGACDMPELIGRTLRAREPVTSFPVTEYWIDIGNPDDLRRAAEEFPVQQALVSGAGSKRA